MVTGAYSVIYYGRPRASHDVDFVVEMYLEDIPKIKKVFAQISPHEFMVDVNMIEEAIKNKGSFNVHHYPSGTKLDFWMIKNDPFDKVKFSRRLKKRLLGKMITLSSPEDTVLQKLRWYKQCDIEKHLIDAAFVYQLQKKLDHDYINTWAEKLAVTDLLPKLKEIDLEEHY